MDGTRKPRCPWSTTLREAILQNIEHKQKRVGAYRRVGILSPRAKLGHSFAGSFRRAELRARQEIDRTCRPKSAMEGTSSMARTIEPPRSKPIAKLQGAIMDWGLRMAGHEAWCVKVAAARKFLSSTSQDRTRTLTSGATWQCLCVGEKMVQRGHAPTEIGHVVGGDAKLGEVRTSRPRRDERAPETQARHGGKPILSPTNAEKRELDSSQGSLRGQKKKRSLRRQRRFCSVSRQVIE